MGKYTIFYMFENPRRGMQGRIFTTNVPKILDLKSSSEQMFFRKLSLGAPDAKTRFLEEIDNGSKSLIPVAQVSQLTRGRMCTATSPSSMLFTCVKGRPVIT